MATTPTSDLPATVQRALDEVVRVARALLAHRLHSIVLYGSAAEGRLRRTSDVNVIFVLESFDAAAVDGMSEVLQTAVASISLAPMFLLKSEIPAAASAFAVKFDDIAHRRKVLDGPDPFEGLSVSRERLVARLQQVLLNLTLRLRARYATRSVFEDQVARAVADASGPLRAAAAALLQLQGQTPASPKAALETVAQSFADPAITAAVARLSTVRERRTLPPGTAAPTLAALLDLATRMKDTAERLN